MTKEILTKEEAIKKYDELVKEYNERARGIYAYACLYKRSSEYPEWLKEQIKNQKKMSKYLDKLLAIYKGW